LEFKAAKDVSKLLVLKSAPSTAIQFFVEPFTMEVEESQYFDVRVKLICVYLLWEGVNKRHAKSHQEQFAYSRRFQLQYS